MVYDATIGQVVLIAAGAVLLAAAAQDFLDYLIPNRLVLALVALYPIYVLAAGGGAVDWLGGILVGGAVLIAGLVLFAFRLIGGGDAKLLAATSLWAGPALILPFLLLTAVAGGILALMMIAAARLTIFFPQLLRIVPQQTAVLGQQNLAYGVAIAAGGLFVLARHMVA
jgi:prepilin peptidase CpaA